MLSIGWFLAGWLGAWVVSLLVQRAFSLGGVATIFVQVGLTFVFGFASGRIERWIERR